VVSGPVTASRGTACHARTSRGAAITRVASAMRNSVLWYFQRIARTGHGARARLLKRFDYGNADPSSGWTTFWLGESLIISPDEQLRFCSGCMRTICR